MRAGSLVALTGDIDDGMEDFDTCIRPLAEMLSACQTRMTIPVTAAALPLNPRKIGYLAESGHEITGHGDVHIPFRGPIEAQVERLRAMKRTFLEILGFEPVGFRAPYMAHDSNLYTALSLEGFMYDSSRVAVDPVAYLRYSLTNRSFLPRQEGFAFPRALIRYLFRASSPMPLVVAKGIVELPVSEFDDWFLLDAPHGPRLAGDRERKILDIWLEASRHFGSRRHVCVIQAHPKRMSPTRLKIIEEFVDEVTDSGHELVTLREMASRTIHGDTNVGPQ